MLGWLLDSGTGFLVLHGAFWPFFRVGLNPWRESGCHVAGQALATSFLRVLGGLRIAFIAAQGTLSSLLLVSLYLRVGLMTRDFSLIEVGDASPT